MFNNFMERYGASIDDEMRRVVDRYDHLPATFADMIRYPMGWVNADASPYDRPTGKRIRPMLVLLSAEAADGTWQAALPAAAAVELLHNFSLVHDDIQDNSNIRHNRPTVWKVWGQPMAINIGDAMFALSYDALSGLKGALPAETLLDIWDIYNHTIIELTRGQYMDMQFETTLDVTTDDYLSMIEGKTAALLATGCQIGALIGSNNPARALHFRAFGLNLGLAFQVRDDILGIWGEPDQTGKSAATDIISRKKSLPVLYGLSKSDELRKIYQHPHTDNAEVQRAVAILNDVGALEFTRELETSYYTQSQQAFAATGASGEAADLLMQLVNALFGRSH
ncbi:MAG: polyprenyl synthetase family protein [Chloroflexota bacterium]